MVNAQTRGPMTFRASTSARFVATRQLPMVHEVAKLGGVTETAKLLASRRPLRWLTNLSSPSGDD